MSELGDMAAGQAWKIATVALAAVLLAGGGAGGALWWAAAAARDQAQADLKAEQGVSALLRAGVDAQNTAILAQAQLAREAEAHGAVAQALAATAGKRFDTALQHLASARPASCADAMPYVNKLLEDVR